MKQKSHFRRTSVMMIGILYFLMTIMALLHALDFGAFEDG
jgi:hypothetical protein